MEELLLLAVICCIASVAVCALCLLGDLILKVRREFRRETRLRRKMEDFDVRS